MSILQRFILKHYDQISEVVKALEHKKCKNESRILKIQLRQLSPELINWIQLTATFSSCSMINQNPDHYHYRKRFVWNGKSYHIDYPLMTDQLQNMSPSTPIIFSRRGV